MAIVGSKETIGGKEVAIFVEVDDPPRGATASDWRSEGDQARGERLEKIFDGTRDIFGEGLALARDCATRAVESFGETTAKMRPDSFELQLAIKLDVQSGAILAKVGAGAQMQVTMKWENRREV